MEYGQLDCPVTEVIHYLAHCGMTLPQMKNLLELACVAERKQDYWLSRCEQGPANSLRSLIYHESTASRTVHYEPLLVPGLLQTPDYAKARISHAGGISDADIEAGPSPDESAAGSL